MQSIYWEAEGAFYSKGFQNVSDQTAAGVLW